jgi:RNA polymerase sigma factor (sigma-70 family)
MNRILVVDDDRAIVEALQETLDSESLDNVGAFSQASAEDLISKEFFPVILADLRLRTMAEGLGLLEQIRRCSPNSAVVTITGSVDDVIRVRLEELGSRAVLLKPVEPEVLIALVREMLGEIAVAAAGGVEEDIEVLYATVTPKLRAMAYRRYGFSGEEADDLVQKAWLLYVEKKSSIRATRAWMTGTVLNLCKQEIQRRYRERAFEAASNETEATRCGADDAHIALSQALARLDERGRELCIRIGIERQSYEEVSVAMNLPIGSIGPLFIRAKDRMRGVLTQAA